MIILYIIVLNICVPIFVGAQEDSEGIIQEEAISGFDNEIIVEKDDDVLSGFDDEEDEFKINEDNVSPDIEESLSSLYGNTGINISYSYAKELPADKTDADWSGFTKVQPFFSLTWDVKFDANWQTRISGKAFYNFVYGYKGRENFSKEVLNELEKEAELREVYLEGSPLLSLDIRHGKQIVFWGVGDSLRVVDVLNPLDNREFGMTDLDDTRIPINMTRFDYYFGDFKLQAVAVHKIKFNKSPPIGSDFNPATKKIDEIIPNSTAENKEYGLALLGIFSGWEASLHWAQYFDDNTHFKISKITVIPGVGVVPTYEMHHSRLTMFGMTFSIPSGNYLWKTEAAKLNGKEFANVTYKTFSRLDLLFGLEFSGWSETYVSFESLVQHLNGFDPRLEKLPDSELEDRFTNSVSFTKDYLNQTLEVNIVGMMVGEQGKDGAINRASLKYDLVDAFSVKGGVIVYQPGESEYFRSLNGNDRIFFEVHYSF